MTSSRDERLLLAADGTAMFGTWIDFLAILTLAAYRFEVTSFQMALFSTAAVLPGILLSPWAGRLCDRGDGAHARRALLGSIVLRILTTAGVMVCADLGLLIVLVALRSALTAVLAPAVGVTAVRTVPIERRPRFYSLLNVLNSGAKLLAPALGGIASSLAGERLALGVSLGLAALSLLLFALIRAPARSEGSQAHAMPPAGPGIGWGISEFTLLLWIAGSYAFFVFMVNNLFPLILQRSGFDKALLGVLISCSAAGNIVSGLWLARRAASHPMVGALAELLVPAACSAAGFAAIGLTLLWHPPRADTVLAATFFVGGIFSARFAVATSVCIATRHAHSVGHASSLLQGCQSTMMLVAPMLGAAVLDRAGPASVLLAAALIGAVALAAAWLLACQGVGVSTSVCSAAPPQTGT